MGKTQEKITDCTHVYTRTSLTTSFEKTFGNRKITMQWHIHAPISNLDERLNPHKLYEIITNLCPNQIKHTTKKGTSKLMIQGSQTIDFLHLWAMINATRLLVNHHTKHQSFHLMSRGVHVLVIIVWNGHICLLRLHIHHQSHYRIKYLSIINSFDTSKIGPERILNMRPRNPFFFYHMPISAIQ